MRNIKMNIQEELRNLSLSVYFIGYENEGESSVFILHSNNPQKRILYSMVIDCYENEQINCTEEILGEYEKEFLAKKKKDKKIKLDMLIWTHPHIDHSKGIEKLLDNHCDKSTKIITANVFNTDIHYCDECNIIIDKISHLNDYQKKKWNISGTETLGNVLQQIEFLNARRLINNLTIRCIAPVSDMISKRLKDSEINKLSVGIIVEIKRDDGNINFLFSSDIESPTFQEIVEEQEACAIPNRYTYIKLPHHGGSSAKDMVKLLDLKYKSDYAVTSVYNKTAVKNRKTITYKNPDRETIKLYKDYIENIGATADVFNNKNGLGVLKITYDLLNCEVIKQNYGTALENII